MFSSRSVCESVCVQGAQYTQQECGPNDSLLQMTSAVSASNTAKCCIQRRNVCVCPGCAAGPQTDKGVPSRFALKCVFSEMWGQLYDFLFNPLSHTHLVLSISVAEADIYVLYPGVCDVIHFKVPFWSVPKSLRPS